MNKNQKTHKTNKNNNQAYNNNNKISQRKIKKIS